MPEPARSPEELDLLLEDAFLLGNRAGFEVLFESRARMVVGNREAHGTEAIAALLASIAPQRRPYVARTPRVIQSQESALLVAAEAIHVLRCGADRGWRAAISLITPEPMEER